MYIIGVDVGGTNTDAVLVRIESGRLPEVLATNKTTTSRDVFSGMLGAIQQVYKEYNVAAVMVGTTHFINALIQRKNLAKVCTLRLCGPATHSLPPMSNWPNDLKQQVDGLTSCISGGYFYDGSPISDLIEDEVRQLVRQARDRGIQSFCVAGVFSPCRSDQEERVAAIIQEESPDAFITLSHKIAGLGLFERENASILNACLRPLAVQTMKALEKALPVGLPLFLTQNNGTLLSLDQCAQFPIKTFASGATNSMIGAAHLTGINNGIVIDIGGTSTDIGVLINGRPRETQATAKLVDDIRVKMGIPDTVSLPLGGGTVVHLDENKQVKRLGPDSVGYQLDKQGLAFGGSIITTTDVALVAGLVSGIGHTTVQLPSSIVGQALKSIRHMINAGVERMKTSQEPVPVILCGGGSILMDSSYSLEGITKMIRPDHFAVCNAVGAALCAVSGTLEAIVDLPPSSIDGGKQRQSELDRLKLAVQQKCEQNGADPMTINLIDIEQVPLAYYPGGYKHRVLLTAVGKLDIHRLKFSYQKINEKQNSSEIMEQSFEDSKSPTYTNMHNKVPIFDMNGVWMIDDIDIEYIAYGAGVLGKTTCSMNKACDIEQRSFMIGCGGGGDSYHSKLSCLEILRRNKNAIRVIPASSLDPSSDSTVGVGFMGAPTVAQEQLPNGSECAQGVKAIEDYLGKKVTAIISGEIGGANGLRCFLVGAAKQLPCVDCDLMGRAFPRLDHSLPFIHDQPLTPTCLTDVRGRTVLYTEEMIPNAIILEETLRKECIKMGLRGALCFPPLTGKQVHEHTILHTISQAWFLGRAKFTYSNDAIRAVAKAGQGKILISDGKVINVEQYTTTGFARGHVHIDVEGKILIIDFQNENLVARFDDEQIIASVPDLITLIEQDSSEPLSTENVKHGCRVSVLVLPAPQRMTTPEALRIVGPQAFGYKYHYTPICNQIPLKSVWDVFYNETALAFTD